MPGMARRLRQWTRETEGSYHIVSRLSGERAWFDDVEKEEFLRQLERYAKGYFVQIHAFCVMSNHFHLLVTGQEEAAKTASRRQLEKRYRAMFGKRANPPWGSLENDGTIAPDPDGGEARLRARLSSVSRFLQELKASFAKWLNTHRGCKGTVWGDRFGAVVTEKVGDAELVQAAYIDLNPIRANLARVPEDYRWSSAGLKVRSPRRARGLLTPLNHPEIARKGEAWYRMFVYCCGAEPPKRKRGRGRSRAHDGRAGAAVLDWKPGRLPEADAQAIVERAGHLGVLQRLRYRCRNLSEGMLVGSARFVTDWQRATGRKHVRARPFLDPGGGAGGGDAPGATAAGLFGTRQLRAPS